MRSGKIVVLMLIAFSILLIAGYQSGWAQAKKEITPAKIGVVSIRRILEESQKNADWDKKMQAEGEEIMGQLQKFSKEAEAIKADMDTRKVGSSDYLKLMGEVMERKAQLEARDKFHQQEFSLRQQRWTESLYEEIRTNSAKIAKAKGLDIVIAKDEYEFPAPSANELLLTIKMGKLLYYSDHMDITDEILTSLDSSK